MILAVSGRIGSGKDTVGKIIQYLTSNEGKKMSYSSFCLLQERWYNHNDFIIKKFAGKLKQIVSILTGIPVEDLEKQEVKDSYLPEEWNKLMPYIGDFNYPPLTQYQKYTVRQLLQEIGTEAMRDVIHPNVWVNALFADYKPQNELITVWGDKINSRKVIRTLGGNLYEVINSVYPNWVITDLRFPNELDAIKQRGGITIRVNRPVENYPENHKFNGDTQSAIKIAHNHPSETALDNATFDYTIINDGSIEELIEKVKEILTKNQLI